MKSRRLSLLIGLIMAVVIVTSLFMFIGCGEETPPPPTEQKTLKIGVAACLMFQQNQPYELMAEIDNANGGWKIGDEYYQIELVTYDSGFVDVPTAVAAVNKLVYEDQVQFILTDPIASIAGWVATTEANHVLVICGTGGSDILGPQNHYTFCGDTSPADPICPAAWFAQKFPNLKSLVIAVPDRALSTNRAAGSKAVFESLGFTVDIETYPPDATDVSALATKVVNLNPDVFMADAGGPVADPAAFAAVYKAGYTGQFFTVATMTTVYLVAGCPIEGLEGFLGNSAPAEFDPTPVQLAKVFKDAWIAKYGEWTNPELSSVPAWHCLKAAMEKAGSIDVDEVAEALGSGLKFDSVMGPVQMISRPDLGNDRTVDSVREYYIREIINGVPTLFDTMSLDDAIEAYQKFLGID